MSKWRRAARIDENQPKIVKELLAKGISVQPGMDDILVGYKGRTYWIEIKTGPKAALKPSQVRLMDEWKGHYMIAWSTEMILTAIGYEADF